MHESKTKLKILKNVLASIISKSINSNMLKNKFPSELKLAEKTTTLFKDGNR